jgi:hypothetical protein
MAGYAPAGNEGTEMAMRFLPRKIAIVLVGMGTFFGAAAPTFAADKVTFLTSWFAQPSRAASTRPKRPDFTRRPVST